MPRAAFEPMIPVFRLFQNISTLDRAATWTGAVWFLYEPLHDSCISSFQGLPNTGFKMIKSVLITRIKEPDSTITENNMHS